jgi:hypothetical protein
MKSLALFPDKQPVTMSTFDTSMGALESPHSKTKRPTSAMPNSSATSLQVAV